MVNPWDGNQGDRLLIRDGLAIQICAYLDQEGRRGADPRVSTPAHQPGHTCRGHG